MLLGGNAADAGFYEIAIENVGDGPLHTSFWTDDLFDAAKPDTIPERVLP